MSDVVLSCYLKKLTFLDIHRCDRKLHVSRCVQRRLAYSAGVSLAKGKARPLVAWMAGRMETESLKPIDILIVRMRASHQAVAEANAEVPSKV